MTVTETVALMLKNWPSLYATRLDALMHLFGQADAAWIGGQLVPKDDCGLYEPDEETVHDEAGPLRALKRVKTEGQRQAVLGDLIQARRRNMEIAFVRANAEFLAEFKDGRFSEVPRFVMHDHFADMPLDVQPDWRAAAVELANALLLYAIPLDEGRDLLSEEALADERAAVADAKKKARAFLGRPEVPLSADANPDASTSPAPVAAPRIEKPYELIVVGFRSYREVVEVLNDYHASGREVVSIQSHPAPRNSQEMEFEILMKRTA